MQEQTIQKTYSQIFIALLFILFSTAAALNAQDRIPREYVSPEDLISFDRETSFPDAISIISDYIAEREDRLLIDRTGYSGPIGVRIPPMHWQDALHYILRVQNMALHEDPEFYEVLTRDQTEQRTARPEGPERIDPETLHATTQTREVRINATFFEGSRRALREVGVDWSTLTSMTPPDASGYLSGDAQLPGSFDNRFVSVNASGAQSVSQNVFNSLVNFGDVGSGIEVQALFSAFEADNLGDVLATPSIKVMDGEEGRIQVGEDFSIKQRDFAGNITDQFFSTGTILTVTPQIIDYQDTTFIYLDLEVERSSAQPDPVSTVISKEEASTHSLLLDGESTVIAGLYRTDRSEVRRGIPVLKDLPPWFFGLRYLFGYNSTDVSQTELVVLIQAELEETIPNRMVQQLRSKRELLERQQQRHRQELDIISGQELEGEFFESQLEDERQQEVRPDRNSEPETLRESPDENETAPVRTQQTPEAEADEENLRQPQRPESRTEIREPERPESSTLNRQVDRGDRETTRRQETNTQVRDMNLRVETEPDRYYTIAGSFSDMGNARELHGELRRQGYEDAQLIYDPSSELYRVAYAGFSDREEALQFTLEIQRNRQSEAWLTVSSD